MQPDVILGFLLSSLEHEEPATAATAVVGIAKLMLSDMVTDEEVSRWCWCAQIVGRRSSSLTHLLQILSRLALLYFASETADNQELRQCLGYFFPVYSYSNPANQQRVANVSSRSESKLVLHVCSDSSTLQIFLPVLSLLKSVYDDLGDKAAMVTPLQIGLQLIDWTDPQKALSVASRRIITVALCELTLIDGSRETPGVQSDELNHYNLAIEMVKKLYTEEQSECRACPSRSGRGA